jgi:hypothetical protein
MPTAASTGVPLLTCLGRPLDLSPEAFGTLRRSDDAAADPVEIRRRMDEDGYVYLPGFHPRDEVLDVRREMLERLAREGALDPAAPLMDGVLREGAAVHFRPDLSRGNAPLQRLLYGDRLMGWFEAFLGQPARHYDYTWVRCIGRGHGTPPHYDIVYMGRGTRNLWTVWTPIGDVPWELGGLMIMPGTHKHERLIKGYGSRDVDTYCLSKPGTGWNAPGFDGWLSHDAPGVRRGLKGRWCSTEYRAGDIVVFSTVLVHAGLDNHTNRVRLSTDSRYQPASEPADERWIGPNPPAHGPKAKRALIC